jgi:sterol desaturase/sphingolipid hydroxylase (fatty acid hydroxylase superfamily)
MDAQAQWTQVLVVASVMAAFALAEWATGTLFPSEANREDKRLDVVAIFIMPGVTGSVLLASGALCQWLAPDWRNALSGWSWWQMLALLLVADDFTQYLWHRLSHTSLMWPLHRAHHSAAYMSVRIVYRNNLLYYLLMPGLWLSGLMLHLGFGWVYVVYSIVKMTVIMGAHCAIRWDEALYRRPWLRPLAWVLERTISTPATHFAHHALVQDDGIGHYTCNYGNLLFVWDMLLGTGRITRQYPPAYGLRDDRRHGPEHWLTQLAFPLRKSTRAETVLGRGSHRPLD